MEGITPPANVTEDFNLPSPKRVELLNELQTAIGPMPKYFWAACQVCELSKLQEWIDIASISPSVVRLCAERTRPMVRYWAQKLNPKTLSKGSTPDQSLNPLDSPMLATMSACPETPPQASISNKLANPSLFNPDQPSTMSTCPETPPQASTSDRVSKMKLSSSPPPSTIPSKRKYLALSSSSTTPTSLSKRLRRDDKPLSRSQACVDAASKRDNECCVLTHNGWPKVAYIYPHCSMKNKENEYRQRHVFWDCLKTFWDEDKVAKWQAHIFPEGIQNIGKERVDNLISLALDVHNYWQRGAFALKPVLLSADKKALIVQFFWQKVPKDIQPTMDLSRQPPSTEGLEEYETADGRTAWLYTGNHLRIKSGEYFELTTTDPENMPLPNFELLEMQWLLQRVLGMAGGAEEVELEDVSEDSDDITTAARDYGEGEDEIPSLDLNEPRVQSWLHDLPPSSDDVLSEIQSAMLHN